MVVYIVSLEDYSNEITASTIIAVFSSEEAAEEYIDEHADDDEYSDSCYSIREMEVDA